MSTKALLVVDMQKDFCFDLRRKHKVEEMIEPLTQAIDFFDAADASIFYICLSLQPDDEQFVRFGDRYCIEGTDGAELIPELFPLKGEIIKKSKHSAFFDTQLDKRLRDNNVKEVYLVGIQTQICIMTTSADSHFRGYHAVTISDCVLSTQEKNKQEALQWIAKYVGDVMPLAQVTELLSDV